MLHPRVILLAGILAAFTCVWSTIPAATLTVDQSGAGNFTAIQPAIDAAQDGDTVLVKSGEYLITEPIDFNHAHNPNDPNSPPAKNINLLSENGADHTIISMSNSPKNPDLASVILFHSGESNSSSLTGFTLRNGNGSKYQQSHINNGGGILCINSNPTAQYCIFKNNKAFLGGGIMTDNSNIAINSCQFMQNVAVMGGAIENGTGSVLTASGCIFTDNIAIEGGAGGGIDNWTGSMATINNSVIANNIAETEGGGIHNLYSYLYANNCIFYRNRVPAYGAAIYSASSNIYTTNCIFTENEAVGIYGHIGGAGLFLTGGSNSVVSNCIYWKNIASGIIDESAQISISGGPVVADVIYTLVDGIDKFKDGIGNIDADPLFDDPANGSFRQTPNSPTINAGTPTDAPAFDFDGNPRPCGAGIDIGAYEMCVSLVAPMISMDGCRFEVPIYLNSTEQVRGLTLGLAHDPSVVTLSEIIPGSAYSTCGFQSFITDTAATCVTGEYGGTLGVIFNTSCTLSAGHNEIARFIYQAKKEGSTSLGFSTCLGSPPVDIVVTATSGSITPTLLSGSLQAPYSCLMTGRAILEQPKPRPNITDVIWILLCLFNIEPDKCPACLDVADVNDDGAFDILDPVSLIDYLFRKGPPPAQPFPGCGFDLTEDNLPHCADVACP